MGAGKEQQLRERLQAIEDELREVCRGLKERESLASRDVELREELLRTRRELARLARDALSMAVV